jgi:hypothetical protein
VALPLAGALVLSACEIDYKAEPVPDRTAIAGDSVTFQAGYNGGGWPGWDDAGKVIIGGNAGHAQPRLTLDVDNAATSPETLIMAFGSNDAAKGYPAAARNRTLALALTGHADSCTVMVKPWNITLDPIRAQGIIDYRDHVDQLVAQFPGRIASVDWRPIAIQPGILSADGIHVTTDGTTSGALAFNDFLRAAPAACDA